MINIGKLQSYSCPGCVAKVKPYMVVLYPSGRKAVYLCECGEKFEVRSEKGDE